jgi:hypothetical protein
MFRRREQQLEQEEIDRMVKEYLDKGGVITRHKAYERTENIEYKRKFGRGRKKKAAE